MMDEALPPGFVDADQDTALVRIGDIRLRYRRNDGGGTHYLGRGHSEEYHSPFYPLLRAALSPARCIDIGANYGYTGLLMRRAFPKAHLALVEPVPWLAPYVRHNFAMNEVDFQEFHSAICSTSDAGAVSTFGVRERGTQDSRVIPQPGMTVVETAVVTLQSLAGAVAQTDGVYIKIDTQGWEERVFAGGEDFLCSHARWFAKTEFAPQWLESQGTDPVVLLRWLLARFDVHESSGRLRWNCATLAEAIGAALTPGCEGDFVRYVRKLALDDRGWVDLYVLPKAKRRAYDTATAV